MNLEDTQLNPCPLCGKSVAIMDCSGPLAGDSQDIMILFAIDCYSCHLSLTDFTIEDLIKKWNKLSLSKEE